MMSKSFFLLAVTLGILLGTIAVHAAPATRLLFPIVANSQAAAQVVTLVEDDSTFVNAVFAPGNCVILSYIDRAHGNRLHIVRDAGDHVVEVELPPIAQTIVAQPTLAFVAPGDKQADGTLMVVGTSLVLYYTSRDEGDPTGPFKLKRLTMPLPGCGP